MTYPYRLGLDLGTNSIGWAIWELRNGIPETILDAGVRIFSDSREPGKGGLLGDPLAVQRRDARSMRRRRDRTLQRKRNLVNALIREKLWPDNPDSRIKYSDWDPYALRAKALSEDLTSEELGRVLIHLCQRRGFKSNRKDQKKDDDNGVNKKRIAALNQEVAASGFETLGEFQNSRKRSGIRFRENAEFYPDRAHYESEFDLIRKHQSKGFPETDWNKLREIIFNQRPLRPQKKGKCRIYSDQDRAHKALPSSQRFRILQELANLRMINDVGESVSLSRDERDMLYNQLENQQTMAFGAVRNKLGVDWRFNLESGKRGKLEGNKTSYIMRKPERFGALWDEWDDVAQDNFIHGLMEAEQDEEILVLLEGLPLTEEQKVNIVNTPLQPGIGSYSAALQRECNSVMVRELVGYSDALKLLGFDHRSEDGKGEDAELPYYGKALPDSCIIREEPNQNDDERLYGKIGNPTVHITLNQLRKVVNSLVHKYGKPDEIVVELARELKLGRQKLSEIVSEQTKNQKDNERLDEELRTVHRIAVPTGADRQKLRLYKELQKDNASGQCPYCGKTISAEELFDGNIEVEHILPFSRTMDDGRNNKTVAHRSCNLKKRERSPYEAFGGSPDGYVWEDILSRIRTLPKAKQWRFQQDAMEQYENQSSFLQRQITDNAYIARVARRYLTSICPPNKVWGTTGRLTAVLRRKWDMNSILSKDGSTKNRSDHRHHAVDAAVIALVDRSLVKKIADANRVGEGDLERFKYKIPDFPGGDEGRARLFEVIKKILPSFKPDHGLQGRFFKETAYGMIRKGLSLPTAKLTEDMLDDIVPAERRQEFLDLIDEVGFNKARKQLQKEHPTMTALQSLWVTSKPITSLDESDLKEPAYSSNTKGPSDFRLRRRIREYLDRYPGEKTEKVLERFAAENGIRHVRYIPKNQEITEIASSPGKGYEIDDYAYVEVWKLPAPEGRKPKYEGIFVSRLEANQIAQGLTEPRRPHPAARKLMVLFKNDVISLREDDSWMHYRVAGYATKANKIDIQPVWRVDLDWFDQVNNFSLPSAYPKTLVQNWKSINALWQNHEIKKTSVHYDGTFR